MGRGRSERSDQLVDAAYEILQEIQPCSVRAVCYRLFVARVIDSMKTNETARVSRNLVWARESGAIPWEWIVDETRQAERTPMWSNPEEFAKTRSLADQRSRANAGGREVTLAEIYSDLVHTLRLTEEQRDTAMRAELAIEAELLHPIPGAVARVAEACKIRGWV